MQTSESLLARGSSIILLWDCHVSWLTTCPFVRDMMAVQSRKLENLQGEEEETVHYSLGDLTYNIRTYCTVYTSTLFPFLPTTRSHVLKTQVQIQQNNHPPQPPSSQHWRRSRCQIMSLFSSFDNCLKAGIVRSSQHDPHIWKLWLKVFFVNSTAVVLWNIAVQSPANQIPLRQRQRHNTVDDRGHIGGQLRQFQAVVQLCNHAIWSHQLNFKPSQPVR